MVQPLIYLFFDRDVFSMDFSPSLGAHIDLLHDCRRFWGRKTASCSLQAMELLLLGKGREFDIPGAIIPRVWLNFVKQNLPCDQGKDMMAAIWKHNVVDVESLAQLFCIVEQVYREPYSAMMLFRPDAAAVARRLSNLGRIAEAQDFLVALLDEKAFFVLSKDERERALKLLAHIARRRNDSTLLSHAVLMMDSESVAGCIAKAKL